MSLALWKSLQNKLKDSLFLENISPQSAILGFTDQNTNVNTVNHLLLIFKLFVYKNHSKTLSHNHLFKTIKSTIEIELKSCTLSARFPKVTKNGRISSTFSNLISFSSYFSFLSSPTSFLLFLRYSLTKMFLHLIICLNLSNLLFSSCNQVRLIL